MKINSLVIKMLSMKVGLDVTTPSGATYLRDDIESAIGERLSANTIKRLVGTLSYESIPRDTTLDILAQYLGYSSWKLLNEYIQNKISGFNVDDTFIPLFSQPKGREIVLEWDPDRIIKIRHLEEKEYEVVSSVNSKLQTNDKLKLSYIAQGFPLMIAEVIRNGKSLGNYIASSSFGLKRIKLIK